MKIKGLFFAALVGWVAFFIWPLAVHAEMGDASLPVNSRAVLCANRFADRLWSLSRADRDYEVIPNSSSVVRVTLRHDQILLRGHLNDYSEQGDGGNEFLVIEDESAEFKLFSNRAHNSWPVRPGDEIFLLTPRPEEPIHGYLGVGGDKRTRIYFSNDNAKIRLNAIETADAFVGKFNAVVVHNLNKNEKLALQEVGRQASWYLADQNRSRRFVDFGSKGKLQLSHLQEGFSASLKTRGGDSKWTNVKRLLLDDGTNYKKIRVGDEIYFFDQFGKESKYTVKLEDVLQDGAAVRLPANLVKFSGEVTIVRERKGFPFSFLSY